MAENEKTTVVTTGGGAGWTVAVILLAVLIGGGLYLYSSGMLDNSKDIEVKIELPKAE